jgi:hypothetical protein
MLKFKIVDGASQAKIERIVAALDQHGVTARKLFPKHAQSPLGRIFCVDADDGLSVSKLDSLLEEFREDIQYVEGEAKRRPM